MISQKALKQLSEVVVALIQMMEKVDKMKRNYISNKKIMGNYKVLGLFQMRNRFKLKYKVVLNGVLKGKYINFTIV